MKRVLIVGIAALLCVGSQGCQTPRPNFDPFMGKSTVPPPATGSVGPPPGATSDSGGFLQKAPPNLPSTGGMFTPPESNQDLYSPAGLNSAPPVGGYGSGPGNYQSSTTSPSRVGTFAANQAPAATAIPTADETGGGVVQTAATSSIRIVEPNATTEPAQLSATATSDATDIMNLPASGASQMTAAGKMGVDRQALRPLVDSRSYGHAPNYGWLQGQLEYSQLDRQWKLRYIPIDGTTDAFGGSVVLGGEPPQGVEAGQFVRVDGRLASADPAAGGYAPVYEIERIAPVDN